MANDPKYHGNANKSGIYQIENLINGRIYVGRASRFKGRWSTHLSSLRNNKHHNEYLQNDFNKLGEDAFQFEVIEVVKKTSTEVLAEVEQRHIDRVYGLGRQHCYNLDKVASPTDPSVFSYDPDRTRKLKSKVSKEMWKQLEYRKRFIESQKKNWEENSERREAASERMKERHESGSMESAVVTLKKAQPKGRETFKERMKADTEFKKKYQEHGKTKVAKIQERYKKDANFRKKMDAHSRKNITDYNESRELTKKPTFVGPNGKVYDNIYNLAEFARNNGLDLSCAYKLVNGKLKKHRGWKLFTS